MRLISRTHGCVYVHSMYMFRARCIVSLLAIDSGLTFRLRLLLLLICCYPLWGYGVLQRHAFLCCFAIAMVVSLLSALLVPFSEQVPPTAS